MRCKFCSDTIDADSNGFLLSYPSVKPDYYLCDESPDGKHLPIIARDVIQPSRGFTFITCHDTEYKRIGGNPGAYGEWAHVDIVPDEPNADEGNTNWNYGRWEDATPENASHIVIEWASYGDYANGSLERSNFEALIEDFPSSFVVAHGGHGTQALLLPADCSDESLIEALQGLENYPLYNDEHHSNMEWRETHSDENWDGWIKFRLSRELTNAGIDVDAIDADELRQAFYETLRDQDESPYLEDAHNLYFPCWKDSVEALIEKYGGVKE